MIQRRKVKLPRGSGEEPGEEPKTRGRFPAAQLVNILVLNRVPSSRLTPTMSDLGCDAFFSSFPTLSKGSGFRSHTTLRVAELFSHPKCPLADRFPSTPRRTAGYLRRQVPREPTVGRRVLSRISPHALSGVRCRWNPGGGSVSDACSVPAFGFALPS